MNKRIKKTLSLLLALLLVLSLLPAAVFAEGDDAERTQEELVPFDDPAGDEDAVPSDEPEALPPPADEPQLQWHIASRFPDQAFRDFVSSSCDSNHDGYLNDSEIAEATQMDCSGLGIRDLTGIEYFTELKELDCSSNSLSSLDLSANTKLEELSCSYNGLNRLNVRGCAELNYLSSYENELTSLDLSQNKKLESVFCPGNRLASLTVNGADKLRVLQCDNNFLTELDISGNAKLWSLNCEYNGLRSLDLSHNPVLNDLSVDYNMLTGLNLSASTELRRLWCAGNGLTSLDVSTCPKLYLLYCQENSISRLDLSRNPNMTWLDCSYNDLKVLDVGHLTGLKELRCMANMIQRLDVAPLTKLEVLHCYLNRIWELDFRGGSEWMIEAAEGPSTQLSGYPDGALFFGPYEESGQQEYRLAVDEDVSIRTDWNKAPRIYGKTRFDTSTRIAHALIDELGVEKLDTVVVANGLNFADALAGSFLAISRRAPILIVDPGHTEQIKRFIRANVNPNGTVYLLGGTAAVPASMEQGLLGYRVKRLAGQNRYQTNIEILKEGGVNPLSPILVCSGTGFADSLSASASGYPILLVGKTLTQEQLDYLATLGTNHAFIMIGGTGAVSQEVEDACKAFGTTARIGGKDRYETSYLVAKYFYPSARKMLLSYALNFPDGLCGAPLAYFRRAPLLLITDTRSGDALHYSMEPDYLMDHVQALGGPSLISDDTIWNIWGVLG